MNEWKGVGIWKGWRLTIEHSSSSYGQPVLVDPEGNAYGPDDIRRKYTHQEFADKLGISKQALQDRRNRGTVSEPDRMIGGRPYWYESTIRKHLPSE